MRPGRGKLQESRTIIWISSKKSRSKDVFNTVQWEEIHELLCSSYNQADNFAELNSFIFARLCNEIFGIHLNFFMYSDMYQDNLFLEGITGTAPRFYEAE